MSRLVSLPFLHASNMCTGFADTGVVRTSEIWQVTPEQHRQNWGGGGGYRKDSRNGSHLGL